jgi:hypothetical protein
MKDMDCAKFQKTLPDYIENGGGAEEDEHIKSCPVCMDLVQDLKYIADAAKLLMPMDEPSPRVWAGIEKSLKQEDSTRPARGPARPHPFLISPARPGAYYRWGAIGALIVLAFALLVYYNPQRSTRPSAESASLSAAAADFDGEDQQFLTEVGVHAPAMRATYETNLRCVNAYISDARQSVQANPEDDSARDQLMQAYEQKNALFEMGTIRSSQ